MSEFTSDTQEVLNQFDEQRRALAIQIAQTFSNNIGELLVNAKAIENYLEHGYDNSDSIENNPNEVDLPF